MFTITIENLLRFHEYFDDKMISMKDFPLDFDLLIYPVASLHKCGKTWKRKDRATSSAILNLVTWPASVLLVPGLLFQKLFRHCINGLRLIVQQ